MVCLRASTGKAKPTFPQVVATFQRIGHARGISTTIYTPKSWGTFRISAVMLLTVANGGGGYWQGDIMTTDGSVGVDVGGLFFDTLKPLTSQTEQPVRLKPGKPVILTVIPGGDTTGSKYNIFVVVEQLM